MAFESVSKYSKLIEKVISYLVELLKGISVYSEDKIRNDVKDKRWLEAIGTIHIQLTEELKYLFLKQTKTSFTIPLDNDDRRYKKITELMKGMRSKEVFDFALVFNLIKESEYDKLITFNTLRNDFSHSFKKRAKYPEEKIQRSIEDMIKLEKILSVKVKSYS